MKANPRLRNIFIAIGVVLLLFGIGLYLLLPTAGDRGASSAPTIIGVTIRTGDEAGELVYAQEVRFYDEDGNTNVVEWNLVDLSDPTQRPFIEIQNGVVDAPPAVQRVRSTVTETWHCQGHVYVATLEVTLVDQDGNRSKPVRYNIECR